MQVHGIRLEQTGGDTSKRGRSSARCVEVYSGNLSLFECHIASETGSGVAVADSGSVSLRACVLKGSAKCGLLAFDGGKAVCQDCVISDNGLYGLVAQNGGTAGLDSSSFNGNR